MTTETDKPKFIIVKYADQYYPGGKAPYHANVWKTHSANMCEVKVPHYDSREQAKDDLQALRDYNPTVGYGIVEAVE